MTNVPHRTNKAERQPDTAAQARADLARRKIDDRFSGLPLPQRIDAITRKIRRRQTMLDGWDTAFNHGHGGNASAKRELRLQIECEQVELTRQLHETERNMHT